MAGDGIPEGLPLRLLRAGGILLLWGIWLLWRLLTAPFRLGGQGRRARQVRRSLALLLFLALGTAAWKGVPPYWARWVWLDTAETLCRFPKGRDEAQLRDHLRQEAFRLGLLDVAWQEESVLVERHRDELGERLQVRLDLRQRVVFFDRWTVWIPLRGQVEARIQPLQEGPHPLREVFGTNPSASAPIAR